MIVLSEILTYICIESFGFPSNKKKIRSAYMLHNLQVRTHPITASKKTCSQQDTLPTVKHKLCLKTSVLTIFNHSYIELWYI